MADILGDKKICKKCGKCCRLVASLKSYEELCLDAKNGDNVAINFLKLFLPYADIEEAKAVDEKVVNETCAMNKRVYGAETYFYFCRYLGESWLCNVYEMRPKLCRTFPKNEFVPLPDGCAYEGYAFIAREKIKTKVRKAKEQLLDIKVMRQAATDRATIERLNKIEKNAQALIDEYKAFGSTNW